MKYITIALDERIARWLKSRASREKVSVSRFVGNLIHDQMLERSAYDAAMRRFLGKPPVRLKLQGQRYASRAEVNDRHGLR